MRAAIAIAFLATFCASVHASPRFDGMWLSCLPEIHGRGKFSLREIRHEEGNYVYREEWGQNYTSSGTGNVIGNRLIVRGCPSFRGVVDSSCDNAKPPVIFTLNRASVANSPKSVTAALRRGETVRVTESTWEKFSFVCEEQAEKLEVNRAKQFEGLWLTCLPRAQGHAKFSLREITRDDGSNVTVQEWVHNPQTYPATAGNNQLIILDDEKNPAMPFTLDSTSKAKAPGAVTAALRQGKTVRVTEKSWQAFSGVCKELAEKP